MVWAVLWMQVNMQLTSRQAAAAEIGEIRVGCGRVSFCLFCLRHADSSLEKQGGLPLKKLYDCPPGKKLVYDPDTRKTFTVDTEEFNAAHRDFWLYQTRLRRAGLCRCPRNDLWQCTGDCMVCSHYNEEMMVSLDAPVGQAESGLSGHEIHTIPCIGIPENMEHRELLNALYAALDMLPESEFTICKIIMEGKTDIEGISLLNITRAKYRYLKSKVLTKLHKALAPYWY